MALPPVGAQLSVFGGKYSIDTDTDAILDCLAAAGYVGVEGGARDPIMYRRKLEERGLIFGGTHTGLCALIDPGPMIHYLKAVGGHDCCNSGTMAWEARTAADYREAIEILNAAGRRMRDEGIHLHYHNHHFEFEKVDGDTRAIDMLIEGLDPAAADLCVDVAWVLRGGDDPAEFLRKHRDLVGYLHFKDHDGQDWIELGQGKVSFFEIMQVLPELTSARWVMIEQDSSKLDPMDSAAISRRYLRETFGY